MLSALCKLWVAGVGPNWAAVVNMPRSHVSLPAYRFERRRRWIEPPPREASVAAAANLAPTVAPAQPKAETTVQTNPSRQT